MAFTLHKAPLRTRFFFWTTILIVLFSLLLSAFIYVQMKKSIMRDALEKSEIILQQVEAIRDYTAAVIRPEAYRLAGKDQFILELMSTTYVSLRIMERFEEKIKGYSYRRVSTNPRNPNNRADPSEEEKISWFEADSSRTFWQGQLTRADGEVFVSMVPDYMQKDCLHCHGNPDDAPPSMVEQYGDYNGFRYEKGDLAGISSVSVPISSPLTRLRLLAAMIFVMILAGSFGLWLALNLLFDNLVVSRLAAVITTIDKESSPPANAQRTAPESDELDLLKDAFSQLSTHLRTARKGGGQLPNFIGPYVVHRPLCAGTLSWLYSGFHAESQSRVSLKVPFANIADNPIYRSCYRNELRILRNLHHPSLLTIIDSIEQILVCRPLDNYSEYSIASRQPEFSHKAFFTAICNCVAFMHSQGVVHHDLRPELFLVADGLPPLLMDTGLAWWHSTADASHEVGLGPQGHPVYMPPEQIEGLRGDARSDIYSLGVWFYHYLTGTFPVAESEKRISEFLKLKKNFTLPPKIQSKLSPELAEILLRALAPDPRNRYQWIEDFRDDILAQIPPRPAWR